MAYPAICLWLCNTMTKALADSKHDDQQSPQQLAAEVVEPGEALFDSLIEAAAKPPMSESTEAPFPAEEVNLAARQFFTALRLLLHLDEP
jgi:hypothetical protein